MPIRPAMAQKVDHRIGRTTKRSVDANCILKGLDGKDSRNGRSSRNHFDDRRPATWAENSAPGIHRWNSCVCAGKPRPVLPPWRPWSKPCPWSCNVPRSATCKTPLEEFLLRHFARLSSALKRQTSVQNRCLVPRYLPLSIGPPETTSVGKSQTSCAHYHQSGVVLSQPQSRTTPSMGLGTKRLFHVHADQISIQHSPSGACWFRRWT